MKNFISQKDVTCLKSLLALTHKVKKDPYAFHSTGKNKTLGLIFFNPSLRTRMSTQKAANNLGMEVIVMNIDKDGWAIELNDGAVMDHGTQEHIKDAVSVLSEYCDIIGVRTFASLTDRTDDYNEKILNKFVQHARVPIISLESATLHPLQSLTDCLTIDEFKTQKRPKVVLTWAPHPKPLPQAVANSFVEWAKSSDLDLTITNPSAYNRAPAFTAGIQICHEQDQALHGADFVYAKNWSSYEHYGSSFDGLDQWQITANKMKITNRAKFMHCLPIRRNVVASDEVIDADYSLVYQQAANRTYAAQAVLLKLLGYEN